MSALVGVLLLWVVAMVVGTLVANAVLGSGGDELGSPSVVAAQYIVPPVFGLVVTVTVISRRRWWTPTLSDPVPTRAWVWVVPGIVVVGVGRQRPAQCQHRTDAVEQGVVHLGVNREPAVVEAFHQMHLPQRPVPVQQGGVQP